MDADGFVQAICAHPEDDAVRLVFADWLEEHGDPRGEFIRLQIAFARLPADDRHRYEYLRREYELLRAHRSAWQATLGEVPIVEGTFRRGFIGEITLAAPAFVQHADVLFERNPIQAVKLVQVRSVKRLAQCPSLGRVRSLDLSNNVLSDAKLALLLASPYLAGIEQLDLRGNYVGKRAVEALVSANNRVRPRRLNLRHSIDFRRRRRDLRRLRERFGPALSY